MSRKDAFPSLVQKLMPPGIRCSLHGKGSLAWRRERALGSLGPGLPKPAGPVGGPRGVSQGLEHALLPHGITEDQGPQGWDVAGDCSPPKKERSR